MSALSTSELLPALWPAALPRSRPRGWQAKLHGALIAVDSALVAIAVGVTFMALFSPGQSIGGVAEVSYQLAAPVVALAWVIALELTGSRDPRHAGVGLAEYRKVITASVVVFGLLAIVSYVMQASLSRALFITTLPLGLTMLLAGRMFVRRYLARLRARGRALAPALVVGTGEQVVQLLADLRSRTEVGYRPAGVCVLGDTPADASGSLDGLHRHSSHQVSGAAASGRYGAVIITDGLPREDIRDLAWKLEHSPVELMFLPRLVDVAGPRMSIRDVEGLSLVHVDLPVFTGYKQVVKRAFDIVFAAVALVLLAPVLALVALLVKLDDGGPIIFRQERVGRFGQPFIIHKFRTMCVDAEAKVAALIAEQGGKAMLFKMECDPRITRIGRILRKYSLDELPQFWSTLRGGMSVVGPRPQLPREVAEYSDIHHRRLLIKPGITGLWQVSGRSALSLEESIRLDLRYVENWSLAGDLAIVLKTVRVVIRPSGAF